MMHVCISSPIRFFIVLIGFVDTLLVNLRCLRLEHVRNVSLQVLLLSVLIYTSTAHADDRLTLVLDWSVNTNHTGIILAQKLGYMQQEGIELHIEAPPQTGAASLVAASTAQIGVSYQEEVTFARSQGVPIVAIATILQHNTSGFAARTSTGITRPRDMSGKRYGGWGGDVEVAILKTLVEADGGDFSSIDIVPIGDVDFFSSTENFIDFIWIFEGWDGIAAKQKNIAINYMPIATIPALDYYTPLLISNETLVKQQPQLLRSALRAISKGYDYARQNPQQAAQILLGYAPELDEKLVIASQAFLANKYQADAPYWGNMRVEVWQRFATWLHDNDLLEGEFVPSDAFTNALLAH